MKRTSFGFAGSVILVALTLIGYSSGGTVSLLAVRAMAMNAIAPAQQRGTPSVSPIVPSLLRTRGPAILSPGLDVGGARSLFRLSNVSNPIPQPYGQFLDALFFSFTAANDVSPSGIVMGDFNGDGNLDVVVANFVGHDIAVLLGNGDGTFGPPVIYPSADGGITARIAIGDFNGDGKQDLAVTNYATGNPTVSIFLGNGDGTFRPQVSYQVGPEAYGIAVGDFNRDGKQDLVVTSFVDNNADSTVSVLLGNGDGTFQPQVQYTVGMAPKSVAVADLNGDGIPDLAVANFCGITADNCTSAGTVSILLGRGDGTFQSAVNYDTGYQPQSVVVGDFNNDGIPDMAAANYCGSYYCDANSSTVSILIGKGDGTFEPQVAYDAGVFGAQGLVVHDFNGDGNADLALGSEFSSVSILLGTGKGTFPSHQLFGTGFGSTSLVTGDFNHDGKTDIVTSDEQSSTISTLLGNGDGTFNTRRDYRTKSTPFWALLNDLKGDGALDLIATDSFANAVSILLGNGTGSLGSHSDFPVGPNPYGAAVGDFNGDGKTDIAVANGNIPPNCFSYGNFCPPNGLGSVSVLIGKGDGTFKRAVNYDLEYWPNAVAVGDFNRDGKLDLAVVNQCGTDSQCSSKGSVSILLGNGDGTFQQPMSFVVGNFSSGIAVADFNGDGKLDLAVVESQCTLASYICPTRGDLHIFLGNGDGTFQSNSPYSLGFLSMGIALGDFNGDGKLDVAIDNACGDDYECGNDGVDVGSVSVLLGNGDGTFQTRVDYPAPFLSAAIVTADFKSDGNLDLAVGSLAYSPTMSVLSGKGDGTFRPAVNYEIGDYPFSLAAGDLNNDGSIDLVSANSGVSVLLNTAGTSVKLTSDPNPSKMGQTVTFSAEVMSSVMGVGILTPTGTVNFYDGATKIGKATLSDGVSILKYSDLSVGRHFIAGIYSGDSNFNKNKSKSIVQVVNK
jgi:hypothetical protein